jgi:hypothetical protein
MKVMVVFDEGAVKTTEPNSTIAVTTPSMSQCSQRAWR